MIKHLLPAALSLVLAVPTAGAQSDEPYFDGPDCTPAPPQVMDIADGGPAPMRVHKVARRSSGFQVALDATAGINWYRLNFLDEEEFTGFVYSAAMTLTWDTNPSRVGLVVRGFYAPSLSGTVDPFLNKEADATADMWGVYLGFYGKYKGFWGSASIGALHVGSIETDAELTDSEKDDYEGSTTIPELSLGLGYDIHLSRHVALRLGGEVGTCFFLTWRAAATGGVVVSF